MFFYNESDSEVSQVQPGGTDEHFSNVSLLLPMDSDFSDSSSNNVTVTENGGISTNSSEYKYGGGSALFSGTNYLTVPNFSGIQFGTEDFTLETWFKQTVAGDVGLFNIGPASYGSYTAVIQSSGAIYHAVYGQPVSSQSSAAGLVSLNAWHHVAFVRVSGVLKVFLDGNEVLSASYGAGIISSDMTIGSLIWGSGASTGQAYLDDIRITKGVARYTANFTPPTEAHPTQGEAPATPTDPNFSNVSLLLPMDSDFSDSSTFSHTVTANGNATIDTNDSKYGAGSTYFDGTDYLTVPRTTELQFGTGDFTIEGWINLDQYSSTRPAIFSNYSAWGSHAVSIFAGHSSANSTKYQVAIGGTFPAIQSSVSVQYNTWIHFALTREAGTVRLFIDGNEEGSTNYTGAADGQGTNVYLGISGDTIAKGGITGNIDDFRITKGVARYTANFTPPTEAHPTS